jgi:ribosomal protein L37AE/L43A
VSTWTHDRKQEQAEVARRVNEVENKKLSDYLCPDCGREFEQVTKGVYGGHRKACLHWKKAAEILEEEMGQTLDEILESNI